MTGGSAMTTVQQLPEPLTRMAIRQQPKATELNDRRCRRLRCGAMLPLLHRRPAKFLMRHLNEFRTIVRPTDDHQVQYQVGEGSPWDDPMNNVVRRLALTSWSVP